MVAAGSALASFVADASASVPDSPAGNPALPAASEVAGEVPASYADAATLSATASWTDRPAQDGAADLAAQWGSHNPAYDSALIRTDTAGQGMASTTSDAPACHF